MTNRRIENISEEKLMEEYVDWRETSLIAEADFRDLDEEEKAEFIEEYTDKICKCVDCGAGSVREDFSNWLGLDEEIEFEKMLELEQEYFSSL